MKSAPLVIAFLVIGCGSSNDPLPAIDRRCAVLPGDDVAIKPSGAGRNYFPNSFGKPAQVCNFKGYPECFATVSKVENDWYPRHWEAADEPSLNERSNSPAAAETSTLRFTWLPSFQHPVIVRIERTGNEARLVAKQLSGQGGYEPGTIEREVRRPLSAAEVAKLDVILSTTKVLEQRPTECDSGLDGSQWIVEGVNRDGYLFVNRWSPEKGPVREFGEFALLLTGWTIDDSR
jgi:hypothetical protein